MGLRVGSSWQNEQNRAWNEVMSERVRQQTREGFGPERDDAYEHDELVRAAEAYRRREPGLWPWGSWLLKFRTRRRDLAKAGALYMAESDRLVRRANRARAEAQKIADEMSALPEENHAVV